MIVANGKFCFCYFIKEQRDLLIVDLSFTHVVM